MNTYLTSPSFYDLIYPTLIIIVIVNILLVLFLIIRTIVLWYWKVDKIVELLEDIKFNTTKYEAKPKVNIEHGEESALPIKHTSSKHGEPNKLWKLLHKEIIFR